jgi:hypothetical protein
MAVLAVAQKIVRYRHVRDVQSNKVYEENRGRSPGYQMNWGGDSSMARSDGPSARAKSPQIELHVAYCRGTFGARLLGKYEMND